MGFSVIYLFSLGILAVSGQDGGNSTKEVIEGTNMCSDGCICDVNISPAAILCQGMDLHVMYEQTDWLATFEAMNISNNVSLDVRFNENLLTEVPVFPPLRIVQLTLRQNLISVIESKAFAELKELNHLDLSFNNLSGHALHEMVFCGQYNESGYFPLPLNHLNLSYNRIHSLDKNTFDHLIHLKTLDLSHNPLKTLAGTTSMAISSLRKLEYLGLSRTGVDSMHAGMLHDLQFLTSLDLSNNEFTMVPNELRFTHALTVLSLDKNQFESLDNNSFVGLDVLEDLSLRNNDKLRIIEEGTFGGLKKMEKLDLSFCRRLETLSDGAFLGLVEKDKEKEWNLYDIRLNDNGLSQIDESLAPWDYVKYIDIRNNPFRCDCNLEWMVKVLLPKIENIRPGLTTEIDCAQPNAMRGKPIMNLMVEPDLFSKCRDSKDELFPDEISLIPSSSYKAAGITVIVIGVLLIIVGVSGIGFLFLKRRAIAKALINHQEIRYERADSDDDGISTLHTSKHKRANGF